MRLWAESELSATCLERLAHAAVLDGLCSLQLISLAKCGSWGLQPSNVNRDLRRGLMRDVQLPDTTKLNIPFIDPKGSVTELLFTDAGIWEPHEVVRAISHHYPAEYDQLFGIKQNFKK